MVLQPALPSASPPHRSVIERTTRAWCCGGGDDDDDAQCRSAIFTTDPVRLSLLKEKKKEKSA